MNNNLLPYHILKYHILKRNNRYAIDDLKAGAENHIYEYGILYLYLQHIERPLHDINISCYVCYKM